ncbi:hypothetical protein EKE94_10390 [Mesobaculum littorinae]|uniref:Iron-binding zinc finger CDGSH type domain-containing protein n=1 Tax=Mesobaculum littorinae TaxID=2486419 RepID=A0A438AGP1_9RHOB|nr:CDGSH iron-sulfur domain-containing protein [Mesobaculum littorinae]RVV97881.1 hypothetical protein EKE94_10390 [Mesobaculum littorinae]
MSDQDDKATSIEVKPNGPFIVHGPVRVVDEDGSDVETGEDKTVLCRCGRSGTKPLCNRVHTRCGVRDDTEAEPYFEDKVKTYTGRVDVLWNPLVCSHAAVCVKRAPEAFDPDQRPWIHPDRGDYPLDRIRDAVRGCPSGALRLVEDGGTPEHLIEGDRPGIVAEANGPLYVTRIELQDWRPAGEGASPDRYTLCRCGLSTNKPFCDGSHSKLEWKSHEEENTGGQGD